CALVARRTARHRDTFHPGDISPAGTPRGQADAPTDAPDGPLRFGTWLILSFITSVMFLATTNQLTQDVAAVPFLWVLPLAIYLVTFIICFDRPEWYSRRWTAIAV